MGADSDENAAHTGWPSRRAGLFLCGFAVWSWVIWPTFLVNIANDPRSFSGAAPTAFFTVHLALVLVSLVLGTVIGIIGWRGWRRSRSIGRSAH